MDSIKQILFQIQENEKNYQQEQMEVTGNPLLKEYIQYLKNKSDESVRNLTLCKTFLSKLAESNLIPIGTRVSIKEFIERIN